jgi:transposase
MGGRPDYERRAKAVELRRSGLSISQIAKELGLSGNGALRKWLKGVPPPEWTKRPRAKDEYRAKAVELRLQGLSYNEIQNHIPVASSTLSDWLKDVPLTEEQREALVNKQVQGNARRAAAVKAQAAAVRVRIRDEAIQQIPDVLGNELFIAGLVAYWAEGAKDKPWRRVSRVTFINSDPRMIRLFLAWLNLIGIEKPRLVYRVSIHENADVKAATQSGRK